MSLSRPLFLVILAFVVASVNVSAEPHEAIRAVAQSPFFVPRGEVITVDNLTLYVSPPGMGDGNSGKAVVWGHDIFGWESGRTKELVDRLAAETEYTVVLPDLFRGESTPPASSYKWETSLIYDWAETIVPYLTSIGVDSVGVVGTCWGSYLVMHASADRDSFGNTNPVRAGFSVHPSHPPVMNGFDEDETFIYMEANARLTAQFFCPTPGDSDNCRPGGLAEEHIDIIGFEEFTRPCIHGYFNRGDLTNPTVNECVERTFGLLKEFFAQHV